MCQSWCTLYKLNSRWLSHHRRTLHMFRFALYYHERNGEENKSISVNVGYVSQWIPIIGIGRYYKKKTFNLWMKFLKYAVLSKHTKSEFWLSIFIFFNPYIGNIVLHILYSYNHRFINTLWIIQTLLKYQVNSYNKLNNTFSDSCLREICLILNDKVSVSPFPPDICYILAEKLRSHSWLNRPIILNLDHLNHRTGTFNK